jgi:uncharacterized protein
LNELKPSEKEPTPYYEDSDGALFVGCARRTISEFLNSSRTQICSDLSGDKYARKQGCFVTLRDRAKELRGCIGFPEPVHTLPKALSLAAVAAATEDPRFSPVTEGELKLVTIEVSILTPPKTIQVNDPRDYLKDVVLGRDGLIMKWPFGSGLLLPQVPLEENWSVDDYLANLSLKAGAMPDQWLLPETVIQRFEAQVFEELAPGGKVRLKQ